MNRGGQVVATCGDRSKISVIAHTLRSDFHYETFIGISPYRTLAVVELQYMAVISLCDLIV